MSWVFDDVAFIEDENNTRIAMLYSYNVPDWKRNGRLIAASDEMYKLLKELAPLLAVHSYSENMAIKISQILARIDGVDYEPEFH